MEILICISKTGRKKITDLLFGKKEDQIKNVWKPCTANTAQIPPEETLVRKERRIEVVKAPKGSTGLADGSIKNKKF